MDDFLDSNPMFTEMELMSAFSDLDYPFQMIEEWYSWGQHSILLQNRLVNRTIRSQPVSLSSPAHSSLGVWCCVSCLHGFYFQMSPTTCWQPSIELDRMMRQLYHEEYLLPTDEDLVNIASLYKVVLNFDGIIGSLDCMHTIWNECPVAWQGSHKSVKGNPSSVREAISDYNIWFWHASFRSCGTLNDKTILDLTPFRAFACWWQRKA